MNVRGAARRKTYDPAHRPRRIALRPRHARDGWQRSSTRGQMQKSSSVRKFHFAPPSRFTSLDHLVGRNEELVRHIEAERLGCLEIESRFVLSGCLHWKVGGLLALEDAVDIAGRAAIVVD